MRFDYNLKYYESSDNYPHLYLCLYNVSADVPSSLLQVSLFDLGSLRTQLFIRSTGLHCSRSTIHSWVQVLSCVNYYSILQSPLTRIGRAVRGKSRLRQKGSRVRKEIPEEGRRAHWSKRFTDINKDEDNCLKNCNTTYIYIYIYIFSIIIR